MWSTIRTRHQPVVAALALLFSGSLLAAALPGAQLVPLQAPSFAQLSNHNFDELSALLMRADDLARASNFSPVEPVTFVLHGDEINLFKRANYGVNQSLVDLAARLDAFEVIDVRVCETWLRDNQVAVTDLPPFVELVPFGPSFQAGLARSGAIPF